MSMKIFRSKRLTSDDDTESGLKRCLSKWDLAFLGIGAIIGLSLIHISQGIVR